VGRRPPPPSSACLQEYHRGELTAQPARQPSDVLPAEGVREEVNRGRHTLEQFPDPVGEIGQPGVHLVDHGLKLRLAESHPSLLGSVQVFEVVQVLRFFLVVGIRDLPASELTVNKEHVTNRYREH